MTAVSEVMAGLRTQAGMPPFVYRDWIEDEPPTVQVGPSPLYDQLANPARYQIACRDGHPDPAIYDCPHIAEHCASVLDVRLGCGPHEVITVGGPA